MIFTLAACLLLLPLIAACSGGGDDGDDPTLAVPTSTAAVATSAPAPTDSASASQEPDFTAGDNAPDPCSLLTAVEVSDAVGAVVKDGVKTQDGAPLGGELCLWSTSDVPVRTFQIDLKDGGDIDVPGLTPEKLYDQSITNLPGLSPTSGIGDKAAFGSGQALVYKDGVYMLTSVGLGTSDTAKAALRTLTEKAAAKL